ncbi:MAG: acyltransferase family protein, partial [Bacteroidota bacterium]
TILRGVAATLVCFYHFIYTTTDYFTNKILLSMSSYGKYGVQMFFVISGIVIPISMINGKYNYSSIFKFFAKRMLRIEIPFIVSIILAIIYLNLRNFIPTSYKIDLTPSFSDFILHLGYLVPFFDNAKWINPVYWTLGIEFQYYLF